MEFTLAAAVREGVGTQKAHKIRNLGQIPAILYGEGQPNENIVVNALETAKLIQRQGTGRLISMELTKGKKAEPLHVLIKDIQKHPVKGNIIHIDFLRVAMDQLVTVKAGVRLINEEKRPRDGAVLEILIHELEVSCLPGNIPDYIVVDISKLAIGGAIHVKDLNLPEGVKALAAPEESVVLASAPTVAAETTAETAAPEAASEKKEA